MEDITFVLTSCNRTDLLNITLDSFFKYNTYPIKRYMVIDDSGKVGCNDFLKEKFPEVEFIYNETNIGQIKSIDKVYKMVKTPWIFHCEEDWEFYREGFIQESLSILKAHPKVITVWLRSLYDTNDQPYSKELYDVNQKTYFRILRYILHNEKGELFKWHGFTFNPGLRRKYDWEKYGEYSKYQISIEDILIKQNEAALSLFYVLQGYIAAILSNDEKGYVRHIGWGRSTIK